MEQKRPLSGLLVPQRVHIRSGGRGGEKSNCGAAGRIGGASLGREGAGAAGGANAGGGGKKGGAGAGCAGAAAGARPRGGVGAAPAPSPETKRFPQS